MKDMRLKALIVLAFFPVLLFSAWEQQISGTVQSLTDVQFLDNNEGWAVGGDRDGDPDVTVVLHTLNGGADWQIVDVGFDDTFRGLFFLNDTLGWLTAYTGDVVKTIDGGGHWTLLDTDNDTTLFDAFFVDSLNGFVIGARATILKTTDGGISWTELITPLTGTRIKLRSAYFVDADTGYVVGHDNWILKTTDRGDTWVQQDTINVDGDLRYVQFVNDSTGWAVGEKGRVLKTSNCGQDWVRQDSVTAIDLWGAHFLDEKVGYVVGDSGAVLFTANGGTNWSLSDTGNDIDLAAISCASAQEAWAVGADGGVMHVTSPGQIELQALSVVHTNQLLMTFNEAPFASAYSIYRGITTDFEPGAGNRIANSIVDEDENTDGIQWTDTDAVIGDATQNYFYKIRGVGLAEGDTSEVFGEFDYDLITTGTTDFNGIGVPLMTDSLLTARNLLNAVPGGSSAARWDESLQSYVQYVENVVLNDFDVHQGYPYYANVTSDGTLTFLGKPAFPSFVLDTTATTDYNGIMLPLHRSDVTLASQLADDIDGCTGVSVLIAASQSYVSYVPGTPASDFSVTPGYPYLVNVDEPVTWPENGLGKARRQPARIQYEDGSKAPHIVWGYRRIEDAILFDAYLKRNPENRLNEASPGCETGDDFWIVQVGNFKGKWYAGDTLHVDFWDAGRTNVIHQSEVVLTYRSADQAADLFTGEADKAAGLPVKFAMTQNYPNPFNGMTQIQYELPAVSDVRLTICNALGQTVRSWNYAAQAAGRYTLEWDGSNQQHAAAGSGVYFYLIEAGSFKKTRKMILLQ